MQINMEIEDFPTRDGDDCLLLFLLYHCITTVAVYERPDNFRVNVTVNNQ